MFCFYLNSLNSTYNSNNTAWKERINESGMIAPVQMRHEEKRKSYPARSIDSQLLPTAMLSQQERQATVLELALQAN